MLSLRSPPPFSFLPTKLLSSSYSSPHRHHYIHQHPKRTTIRPLVTSSVSSTDEYQPFYIPPSPPLPTQFGSLQSNDDRLRTLRDRLGLWFDYAPLISALARDGLSPSSIEESTGISGVEQNRLVVAAQVRHSLLSSGAEPDLVAAFESSIGSPDILYELRLLSNRQRLDAARFVVAGNLDAKAARELARAIKDFPRRRSDRGWDAFSPLSPGDCLAFTYFRQSREKSGSPAAGRVLELAMEVAETEMAKARIMEEMKGGKRGDKEEEEEEQVRVPVVRLKSGEAAEATTVVVLPVCKATPEEVAAAPICMMEEGFGVVTAVAGWRRWVVLPGWEPLVAEDVELVVVEFKDGGVLPWKAKRGIPEEGVLVVVDRKRRAVTDGSNLYLVAGETGGVMAERGSRLAEKGVESAMGNVVLVVRPPKLQTKGLYLEDDWD